MLGLIWTIQVISALLLIVLVLIHSPKGDGIAGIGGSAHMFTSQKGAEKNLNKITTVVTVIFALCVFLLGFGIVR
jgi:preprotein translocase subunit SecG